MIQGNWISYRIQVLTTFFLIVLMNFIIKKKSLETGKLKLTAIRHRKEFTIVEVPN